MDSNQAEMDIWHNSIGDEMAQRVQALTNVASNASAIVSMDMLNERINRIKDNAVSFRNEFAVLIKDSVEFFLGDGNKQIVILNNLIDLNADVAKTLGHDPELAARRMAGYFIRTLGIPHNVIYKKRSISGKDKQIPQLGKKVPKANYPDIKAETLEASVKQFDLKPVKAKPPTPTKEKELTDVEKQQKAREWLKAESKKIDDKINNLKLDTESGAYRLMRELKAACDQAVTELQDSDSE